jgi:lambda family phage portal protein
MNLLDQIIEYVNPSAGMKRAAQRAAINTLRGYDAGSHSRRTQNWRATGADANKELEASLPTLRNRSRDQVRNNVYARRTVQGISTNVVGKGIIPTPEFVTRAAEKRIMKLWKRWAGKARCDANGLLNFYGIQKLVMRTVVESGECLVLRKRANDTMLPLRLMVLEPDFIDTTKTNLISEEEGSITMYGIKFNKQGERLGYWLYDNHPGSDRMLRLTSSFVKAEDVCHVYYVERPGQVRGVPWMTASMMRMKDFDEYEDAELVRQKIAACFTVFVQDTNPDSYTDAAEADIASRVEPGIIEILPPGKSVAFAQPPLTNGHESYSRKTLQGIAIGTGITYEMMTGDLSNVNFSSGRMGWLEFQRNVTDWQDNMVIPMLCDRVWEWFCEAGEIVGQVKKDTEVSWTPPRREMIDPVKETKALSEQVQNGFLSYSEAVRQMGYDPDDTMEEIQSDNQKFDEKGLVLKSDPRQSLKDPGGISEQERPEEE